MKWISLSAVLLMWQAFTVQVSQAQPMLSYAGYSTHGPKADEIKIIIQPGEPAAQHDTLYLQTSPVPVIGIERKWDTIKQALVKGKAGWTIKSEEPLYIYTGKLFKNNNKYWLVEAGDNVSITVEGNRLSFSGEGAEKLWLQYEIKRLRDSLRSRLSNPKDSYTRSMDDYREWCGFLAKQQELIIPLIESYKDKVSPLFYREIRNTALDIILDDRSDKFATFVAYAQSAGLNTAAICAVYDSTYAPFVTPEFLPSLSEGVLGSWAHIRLGIARKYHFEANTATNSNLKRQLLYYAEGMQLYKGEIREHFRLQLLTQQLMRGNGFTPEVEELLDNYYREPGYPEFKQWVKEYERKSRELKTGRPAPDFRLTGLAGNPVTKNDIKGKVALLDFWFTGCVGCIQLAPVLKKIEERFAGDSNMVFLSISIDEQKDQWKNSIKEGKYTSGSARQLYTGGSGDQHPVIKSYNVSGYPSLYLLDAQGKIAASPLPDIRQDNGEQLSCLIEQQLVKLKDGPYVLNKTSPVAYYTEGRSVKEIKPGTTVQDLPVQTDQYERPFSVRLKRQLHIPASEYAQPEKLLALSDIEGNFNAFRKLLQANKVMDEQFNWTFGNGHLVLAGDMFDRGDQVTECLWLIYSLEEKAEAAGGYVHFILGNHELMNLQQDYRYVHPKYAGSATALGKPIPVLYSEDSELGRWLRTKNIIERIGETLFTHAGISAGVNQLPVGLQEINQLARPHYADTAKHFSDPILHTIMSTHHGIFWYRNYYLEQDREIYSNGDTVYKATQQQVDASLKKFHASNIVTGHTIVADTISTHFNGKVINIDTHHAAGHSEALFIENNRYYRVDQTGKKELLPVYHPPADKEKLK